MPEEVKERQTALPAVVSAPTETLTNAFLPLQQNRRVIIRAKLWAMIFVLLLAYVTLVVWLWDYLHHSV